MAIVSAISIAAPRDEIPTIANNRIVLQHAQFTLWDNQSLPPATTQWVDVALPDVWPKAKLTDISGNTILRSPPMLGWYKIRFITPAETAIPRQQIAVYIPRVTNNIEAYLNGQSFYQSGDVTQTIETQWNTPQFFAFPKGLVQTGENILLIRLHTEKHGRVGVSAVSIGPLSEIKPVYAIRKLLQNTAPEMITWMLVFAGIFSLSVWAKRNKETQFGFFGAMCLMGVLRLLAYFMISPPPIIANVAVAALCWMSLWQFQFAIRFTLFRFATFEKIVLWTAVISTIAVFTVPVAALPITSFAVYLVFTVLGVAMIGVIGMAVLRTPNLPSIIAFIAMAINLGLGIHDLLNFAGELEFERMYFLPLGLPLLLLSLASLLLTRFVNSLNSYELLNIELSQRITARERDLDASYAQMRIIDQQRVTSDERQRLMRDMHDGVGSHLMSLLALARMKKLEPKQLEESLADCIDELKLTIDSLEPVEQDLLLVLGNLRYRLEPRLNAAGIRLAWSVTDMPSLPYLDPTRIRSVLRIVQEVFTNALKHAKANRITVSTGIEQMQNRVWVRITDDGIGVTTAQGLSKKLGKPIGGRGVDNMRIRATQLGGSLTVDELLGGGTCVTLFLPLHAPVGSAESV
jgi:signal transduction histidine kinase